MSDFLLQTKFHIPQLRTGEFISRPRLIELLNGGLHRKLTLISAAAGTGKTTLVADWLGQSTHHEPNRKIAWLSLNSEDNDFSRFLAYLVAALQKAEVGLGQTVSQMLQSSQLPRPEAVMTHLINDLATYEQPLTIVLDDYHLVTEAIIHQAWQFWLDNGPQNVHLVMAYRDHSARSYDEMKIRLMHESDIDAITTITVDAWSDLSPNKLLEDKHGVLGTMPWREKKGEDVRAFCLRYPSNVIVTVKIEPVKIESVKIEPAENEAAENETVVGYATFSIDQENGVGHILNNAVAPAFQGRGLGAEMNGWIIEHFRNKKLRLARVSTSVGNIAAQTMYEKQGFEELGRTIHYSLGLT